MERVVDCMCENGSLRDIMTKYKITPEYRHLQLAAKSGNVENIIILEESIKLTGKQKKVLISYATKRGSNILINHLSKYPLKLKSVMLTKLCSKPDVKKIRLIRMLRMGASFEYNNGEAIIALCKHNPKLVLDFDIFELIPDEAVIAAVEMDNLELFDHLAIHGCSLDKNLYVNASETIKNTLKEYQ
jgi:hypothetical protein